jgi:phosphoenolpyruvate carboxykinase (ATP)
MKLEPKAAELLGRGFALSTAGLSGLGAVHWNLAVPALYEQVLQRGEARLSAGGALAALTGARTGRSPLDRFIVQDAATADDIWWGEVNRPIAKDVFDGLQMRVASYLRGRDVFVQDLFAGADPNYRMPVRVITEHAWHNLFARNMFIRPTREERRAFAPRFTVIHAPGFLADPERDGTHSEAFILLDFTRRLVLIGGTAYAGEISRSSRP